MLGDPMRLAQVFRNVISNALKFSYPGTAVSIRAVWRPDRCTGTTTYYSGEGLLILSLIAAHWLHSLGRCGRPEARPPDPARRRVHFCRGLGAWFGSSIDIDLACRRFHSPVFVGLSAENLKLLFKEGVQFNANKLQAGGGSGLGLFIAKGSSCFISSLDSCLDREDE